MLSVTWAIIIKDRSLKPLIIIISLGLKASISFSTLNNPTLDSYKPNINLRQNRQTVYFDSYS
jgi:hypothetical protein